jgi:hypothetical protein
MSIRAIAFHEAIAMEKMDVYFRSPESQLQSETQAGKCVKCNLAFAIVLAVKSDPRNPEYVGHLNAIIAEDCIAGHHRDEYVLEESGPPTRLN